MSNFSINQDPEAIIENAAKELIRASMLKHAFALLTENEEELIAEFMPKTGMDRAGTLGELRKAIHKDAFGFVYRIESRAFVKVLQAREAQAQMAKAAPQADESFDLPAAGFCKMEEGCESCQ